MTQVCDHHLLSSKNLKSPPTPGKDLLEILREISVGRDFILFCKFQGIVSDCSGYLRETITDDGICYTFNMLHLLKSESESDSWNLKNGYDQQDDEGKVYPERAFADADTGFNIVLSQKSSDLDYICRGPVQGYKVKIHAPDEFPRLLSGYQRIGLKSETVISVTPKVTLNKDQTGATCHSDSTKSLKYFKTYSQANCMSECLSDFVLSKCDCVKFTMVHDESSEVCNQQQTSCIVEAVQNFSTNARLQDDFICDCKPSCDSLSYDTKETHGVFDFQRTFNSFNEDLEEFPEAIMSRLVVYVGEESYSPTVIKSSCSLIETVAKVGGILAFFLGASLISFIEIFYYIFRRFTC